MTKQEAIDHYGTQMKLATALGVRQSTISEWGEYPPGIRQLQIERLTRGRLRAEADVLSPKRKRAA
jgi:DNA-binding transcriptional regulator YdaS (Cro superfamily)